MIEALVHAKVDVNAPFPDSRTPLMAYCVQHEPELKTATLLVDAGAQIKAIDLERRSVLMYAVQGGSLDIVKLLLDRGVDPWGMDMYLQDAVGVAREFHHAEIADFLEERINLSPTTHLWNAIEKDDAPSVAKAIQEGADINSLDSNGQTPLMQTIFLNGKGGVDIIRNILKAKPDLKIKNEFGQTALQMAIDSDRQDFVAILKSAGL